MNFRRLRGLVWVAAVVTASVFSPAGADAQATPIERALASWSDTTVDARVPVLIARDRVDARQDIPPHALEGSAVTRRVLVGSHGLAMDCDEENTTFSRCSWHARNLAAGRAESGFEGGVVTFYDLQPKSPDAPDLTMVRVHRVWLSTSPGWPYVEEWELELRPTEDGKSLTVTTARLDATHG